MIFFQFSKQILAILMIIAGTVLFSCNNTENNTQHADNKQIEQPQEVLEQMPEFLGGSEAMLKFINSNMQYPKVALDSKTEGTVVVGFIIDEFGKIKDIIIKKSISKELDEEAIRITKLMPAWKPGIQNDKPMPMEFNLPIQFNLPK